MQVDSLQQLINISSMQSFYSYAISRTYKFLEVSHIAIVNTSIVFSGRSVLTDLQYSPKIS